jgi:DNA-binding SARP family transcriptional activator
MAAVAGRQTHSSVGGRPGRRASPQVEAFDAFPDGLLVLDRTGRVVCSNRVASRLMDLLDVEKAGLTCCTLFGCGTPDTALQGACLTELALARDTPLAELRLELGSRSRRSIWVTAAAIGDGRERLVLQLRPCVAGDGRELTSPQRASGPRLRVRTLGATGVESLEGPIAGAWLDQRAGQLLKFLVAERRRAVAVDEIGESIWPGSDYAVGASIRYYVHTLRRTLEPRRVARQPSAFIASGGGTYRLQLDRVDVDADEFEARVCAGLAAADSGLPVGAEDLERALEIYRGDFLAELPYADWAMPERNRLHDLACLGLRRLAEIRLGVGAVDGAVAALERLATLQPYDEDVHRQLMELDITRGRGSDAVRRYAALRSRLRATFGHDPDFTLAELARKRPR